MVANLSSGADLRCDGGFDDFTNGLTVKRYTPNLPQCFSSTKLAERTVTDRRTPSTRRGSITKKNVKVSLQYDALIVSELLVGLSSHRQVNLTQSPHSLATRHIAMENHDILATERQT